MSEHNDDRCQFGSDRKESEHKVVQNRLVTGQAVVQDLADSTGLAVQMKTQRQPQEVREETTAQNAEHSPLRPRIHEAADLAHRSRQKLTQYVGTDKNEG